MPIVDCYAKCPKCGKKHGRYIWEKSYWAVQKQKLIMSAIIIDGGPVLEVPIKCKDCK